MSAKIMANVSASNYKLSKFQQFKMIQMTLSQSDYVTSLYLL